MYVWANDLEKMALWYDTIPEWPQESLLNDLNLSPYLMLVQQSSNVFNRL